MPRAWKLATLTVEQFKVLLTEHDNKLSEVARTLGVTTRALRYWTNRNCPRVVTYECAEVVKVE